jgi:sugar lactone lactonase YvrE
LADWHYINDIFALQVHVDSIALDRSGKTLFYGAVTSSDLYSVSTEALLRAISSPADIPVVRETAAKPITDGLSSDLAGNVWLTAFARSSLAVAVPADASGGQRRVVKVATSEALLRWPDGLSFGPDGLYVTNSALHLKLESAFAGGDMRARHGPFHIVRLPAAALRTLYAALGQPPGQDLPPAGQ